MKHGSDPGAVSSASEAVHPELDELIDYHREKLDSTAAARVREHLAECQQCTSLLLDLEDFVLAERSQPEPEDVTEARLVARAVSWEVRAERWRLAGLIAASVLLATSVPLGIYFWNHSQREPLEMSGLALEINLPLISLYPRSALRGGRENRLEVPAGTRLIHVLLTTDDLPQEANYELFIFDAAGREVLSLDGLRPTSVGTFSIGLPAARVPPGNYRLRLVRPAGGKKTLVHEYPLQIVAIDGAGSKARARQGPH